MRNALARPANEQAREVIERQRGNSLCDHDHRVINLGRGIFKTRPYIVGFEIRVIGEDIWFRCTAGQHVKYILDTNAHTANTGSTAALTWIRSYPVKQISIHMSNSRGQEVVSQIVNPAVVPYLTGGDCFVIYASGKLARLLNAHDLVFFVLAQLIDFGNICVGQLLHVVEAAAFFVLGDRFVF